MENLENLQRQKDALKEAFDRLEGLGANRQIELSDFTMLHTSDEIKKYLEENRKKLEPEAIFFLEATLWKRKEEPENEKSDQRINESREKESKNLSK